jgi:hypothetical protein
MRQAFALSASVTWSGDAGKKYPFTMKVIGNSLPLLSSDADVVTFDPTDVDAGNQKYIVISGSTFSKLDTWAATLRGNSISVTELSVLDDHRVRVAIRCHMLENLSATLDRLEVSARIAECRRPIDRATATIVIPVKVQHPINLSIIPTRLPISVDPTTGDGKGSLLLRGEESLSIAGTIRSVRCEKCEVEWKATSSAGNQVVLSVVIRKFAKAGTQHAALEIELDGRKPIEIPIVTSIDGI